jgi:mono/diheme cytochrome c family protein
MRQKEVKGHFKLLSIVVPVWFAWSAIMLPAASADGIEAGRILAQKHCAVCHVIGNFNKFGGIGSTPSFQLLASLRDGPERFQTFFARRPHPSFIFLPDQRPPTNLPLNAPPVHLTYQQVKDIARFAKTLKDPRLAEPNN